MGNNNLERNPKSEPKKFSRLCTFKPNVDVFLSDFQIIHFEFRLLSSATVCQNVCCASHLPLPFLVGMDAVSCRNAAMLCVYVCVQIVNTQK